MSILIFLFSYRECFGSAGRVCSNSRTGRVALTISAFIKQRAMSWVEMPYHIIVPEGHVHDA